MFIRQDPGACPICGAAHTACTARPSPITVQQLPSRDASGRVALVEEQPTPPLVAEVVQATLPAGSVTSATYKGKKAK